MNREKIDKAFEAVAKLQRMGKCDEARVELLNIAYYIEHIEELESQNCSETIII